MISGELAILAWSAIPTIAAILSVATQASLGGLQASEAVAARKDTAKQNQQLLARSQLTAQRSSLVGTTGNKTGSANYGDLNPASTGKQSLLGG